MTTYPLTFPSLSIQSSTFRLVNSVSKSMSPFTGEEQVYAWPGQWWEGQVTFPPLNHDDASALKSFLTQLRGQYGTFLYGDPDALAKGLRTGSAGGTILVDGASQTGNTMTVDGMTASSTILQKGDYFQLGTGTSSRLYMVTEDLVSDSAGSGTITFEPNLRSSPADNTALDISSPVGAFRLAENTVEWSSNMSSIYDFTILFREAL